MADLAVVTGKTNIQRILKNDAWQDLDLGSQGNNTQEQLLAYIEPTQETINRATEDNIPPLFKKIEEEGGYTFLDVAEDIDNNRPIRPFVLSAHSSGVVKELKDVIVWKNELEIPIYIVLYSKHGNCGITHNINTLTERIVAIDLPNPQKIKGYKEIFEDYNINFEKRES